MTSLPQRLESTAVEAVFVADKANKKLYSDKPSKAVPLGKLSMLTHSILEDVLAITHNVGVQLFDEDEEPLVRVNDIEAALTAYCIGEGGKTDA